MASVSLALIKLSKFEGATPNFEADQLDRDNGSHTSSEPQVTPFQGNAMSVNDPSESFWICTNITPGVDALDALIYATEFAGLIPGLIVIVLLCQLDGKTRTSLLMLRTLMICAFLQLLINFIEDIYPYQVYTASYNFNMVICVFWTSRFVYWVFSVIGAHAQVYFSTNRTMQIVSNLQLSFSSSRNIDLVYIAGLAAYSVVITIPQILTLAYDGDKCRCGDKVMYLAYLQLAYAEVYIYFFQVLLINSIILLISCALIIRWVHNTPREKFLDTLNALSFPNTPEEELKAYDDVKGWSTSSMCIVPMFISFVISFAYDTTYQFISAIGLTLYPIHGAQQKIGVWLLLIHPMLMPYYLFYYIPALRFWVLKQWRRLMLLCRRREKHSALPI